MAPSLDPFPDLCLIAIFMHLPLSDLLTVVGLVCSGWHRLLPTVLARRHTLKIVQTDLVVKQFEPDYLYGCLGSELIYKIRRDDGSPWVVGPKVDNRNVVVVPETGGQQILTEGFSYGLMNALPNITNLTVIQYVFDFQLPRSGRVFTQITHMLDNCLARFDPHKAFLDPLMRNLLESIDRLRSLRHLKINFTLPPVTFEPELRIFSQLNTLTFSTYSHEHQNWIINSIQQYANLELLTQISTDNSVAFTEWSQFAPTLAAKFHHLGHIHNFDDLEKIETFCARFSSIRYLVAQIASRSLHLMAPSLAKLHHLVHLELKISPDGINGPRTLTPIPSVRLLSINVDTKSHRTLESFRLPQLFPNVQVLQMTHGSEICRDCDYNVRFNLIVNIPKARAKIHECKRMARQVLTRFPKLHTIKLAQYPATGNVTFGPWESDNFNSLDKL